MSVFCLVETKFNDTKSGTEFGDAIFRMGPQHYEKFKWKMFYNTHIQNNVNLLMKMTLYICLENLLSLK